MLAERSEIGDCCEKLLCGTFARAPIEVFGSKGGALPPLVFREGGRLEDGGEDRPGCALLASPMGEECEDVYWRFETGARGDAAKVVGW